MSNFEPTRYLSGMKGWINEVSDEQLAEMLLECDESLDLHQRENELAHALYDAWHVKVERWRDGKRKTFPYPRNGAVDLRYAQEKFQTWSGYWRSKRAIIESEQQRRFVIRTQHPGADMIVSMTRI